MRNCLVVLKNKKMCSEDAEYLSCTRAFAAAGVYFDKIAVVAFDSSRDIIFQLKDCHANYDNSVIMCPRTMDTTLKDYLQPLYGASFDGSGILDNGNLSVFMYFTDGGNASDFERFAEHINSKLQTPFERSYIKAVGAPREDIIRIADEAKSMNPSLECNVFERYGDYTIELVYPRGQTKVMSEIVRKFVSTLDDYVYALENTSIAEQLFQLLKLRKLKMSCAESFTGGGVGRRIVEIPGASEVYYEGLNTYSNESKKERLGVKESTLQTEGAVSAETAKQMANGLMWRGHCNIAVSTTGIAGPKSDNTSKPVGLCYIAVAVKDGLTFKGTTAYKYNISGDRKTITETAINYALFLAYRSIKQNVTQ